MLPKHASKLLLHSRYTTVSFHAKSQPLGIKGVANSSSDQTFRHLSTFASDFLGPVDKFWR